MHPFQLLHTNPGLLHELSCASRSSTKFNRVHGLMWSPISSWTLQWIDSSQNVHGSPIKASIPFLVLPLSYSIYLMIFFFIPRLSRGHMPVEIVMGKLWPVDPLCRDV
jgi:hypothetical protein